MYNLDAMLTFDLNGASTAQRTAFDDSLLKSGWKKSDDSETTWIAAYKEGTSPQGAIIDAENDVKKALEAAKAADSKRNINVTGDLVLTTSGDHKFKFQ